MGGVHYVGVGWVIRGGEGGAGVCMGCRVSGSCRVGLGHVWVGGGLCRGGVHHTEVEWAVKIFTE